MIENKKKSLFKEDFSHNHDALRVAYDIKNDYLKVFDELFDLGYPPQEIEKVFLDVIHTQTMRRIIDYRGGRLQQNREREFLVDLECRMYKHCINVDVIPTEKCNGK